MLIRWLFLTLIVLFSWFLTAETERVQMKIKYISSESIFVDAGKDAGLWLGASLRVTHDGKSIGELKVKFLSRKSSSCIIVTQFEPFSPGDSVILIEKALLPPKEKHPSQEIEERPARKRAVSRNQTYQRKQAREGVRGNLSFQWYQIISDSGSTSDFQQPGLRLNLRGRRLLGGDYEFSVKSRTRYTQRDRPFGSSLPETEWQNRIYRASFGLQNPEKRFNFQVGRLFLTKFPNSGPLDGTVLQFNQSTKTQWGVFAGTHPEWMHTDISRSITKYGGYFNSGYNSSRSWETTLGFSGEYKGSEINREFAFISNRFHWKNLRLFQSAEIEINRGWRQEISGNSFNLTNLYLNMNWKIHDRLSAGLSYDNRRNYRTYEYLTRDELYFDDLFRQGYRMNAQWKILDHTRLMMNYGLRSREGDEDTKSYFANLYQSRFFSSRLSLSLRLHGFSGAISKGTHPSIKLGFRFNKGHMMNFSFETYEYTLISLNQDRKMEWLKWELYWILAKQFYLSSQYEYSFGEDTRGHKVFLELGYRFK